MKKFLSLLFIFVLFSCSHSEIKPTPVSQDGTVFIPEAEKTPQITAPEIASPVTVEEVRPDDYSVRSSLGYIKDVATVANCVVKNRHFLAEIAAKGKFDYTEDHSLIVADKLAKPTPVIISTYYKRFSKAIAYRNLGDNTIYFNTRHNPRPMKEMVNTAIHERAHVAGYGHGDNYSYGKENSVPYWAGNTAEKYVDACNQTETR